MIILLLSTMIIEYGKETQKFSIPRHGLWGREAAGPWRWEAPSLGCSAAAGEWGMCCLFLAVSGSARPSGDGAPGDQLL